MAAAKKKPVKVKADKSPIITGGYSVPADWVKDLNFFDMTGSKAKTKGTSNKFYHIELQEAKDGKCQLYTEYGPTGSVQCREWRYFADDRTSAEREFERIVKAKTKKGYVIIDVAQRAIGSSEAQKHVKAVKFKNATKITKKGSFLHSETARIISTLMTSTNSFVIKTLRCPLGQLSNAQIDEGRDKLNQAKIIVAKDRLEQADKARLEQLTNDFYGLIPHNLGFGARGQMTQLLLDTQVKINQKEYDLDTLLDAKAIGAMLTSDSVYDQYESLQTEFNFIDHNDSLFSWLNSIIQGTRAKNHNHLGKIVLCNAWDIKRRNERNIFLNCAKSIAAECGKQTIPEQMIDFVSARKDIDNLSLYQMANVIPLFHGTRTQNISGILKQGMLIRPSGVVITGAMYGNAIYKSSSSTKSINYTDIKTSYWAKGSDDKAFLFLSDCILGNQFLANGPGSYTLNSIKPNHSVWAKGGRSGVINDEMMLYRTDQHNIRYLLEFSCQKG